MFFVVPVNATATPNTVTGLTNEYSIKNFATKTYKCTEKNKYFEVPTSNGYVKLQNNSLITLTFYRYEIAPSSEFAVYTYSANFTLTNGTSIIERNFDAVGNIPFIIPLQTKSHNYLKNNPTATLSGDILTIKSNYSLPGFSFGPIGFFTAKYNTHTDWLQYYNFTGYGIYNTQLIVTPLNSSSKLSSFIIIDFLTPLAIMGILVLRKKHKT